MADGKYEIEVDPRVEWAMKVMDQEGVDFESEVTKKKIEMRIFGR